MKYFIILILIGVIGIQESSAESYPDLGVKVEIISENLVIPWSIDFAPDGRIFFSERTGTLQVIDKSIQKQIMALDVGNGEGGMLGIALDPNFESNHYIYIYYTYNELFSTKNKLVRYVELNNSVTEDKVLLDDIPGASYHDGGRIKFGPDDKLYVTTGDAGDPNLSQNLDSLAGKILRINSDGTIPADNPWEDSPVYSIGHRNPQGIDWDKSGNLVATEHGPSGWRGVAHDEINLIHPGKNYGWPDIIGDETKNDMINPVLHSGDDTWAPSGATFYYGEILQWNGKYFVASLRGEHLLAIDFDSNYNVISYEKLFLSEYGRLRDVVSGPDGLYVLTSNQDGRGVPTVNDDRIIRITPLYDTEKIPSPLKQIKSGISTNEIECRDDLVLVQRYDGSPACVTDSTKQKLIERMWIDFESDVHILKYSPVLFSGTGVDLQDDDLMEHLKNKREQLRIALNEAGIKRLYSITGISFSVEHNAYSLDGKYVGNPVALGIHILKEEFTKETLEEANQLIRKYVGDEIDIVYSKGDYTIATLGELIENEN